MWTLVLVEGRWEAPPEHPQTSGLQTTNEEEAEVRDWTCLHFLVGDRRALASLCKGSSSTSIILDARMTSPVGEFLATHVASAFGLYVGSTWDFCNYGSFSTFQVGWSFE